MNDDVLLDMISLGKEEIYYYKKYNELINNLLSRGLDRNTSSENMHMHHILPRCMGGKDEENNYVLLTYKEHLVAHILLSRAFPSNKKFKKAVYILTNFILFKTKDNIIIDENMLNRFNDINQDHINSLKIPVVCLDDDMNVQWIYDSITDTNLVSGFHTDSISKILDSGAILYQNYYWYKLTTLTNLFPEKLIEFKEKEERGLIKAPTYKSKSYKVVCFKEKTFEVIKIYDKLDDVKLDKFEPSNIYSIIHNTGKKSSGGYLWDSLENFCTCHDDKVKEFYKNVEETEVSNIKVKKLNLPKKVICLDENNNIIKVYESVTYVNKDGFSHAHVIDVISGKRAYHGGYTWDYISEEEYESLPDSIKSVKNLSPRKSDFRVVGFDEFKNILNIYKNTREISNNPSDWAKINKSIRDGDGKKIMGCFWMRYNKFNDLYPGKIEKFENNNENNL